MPVDPQIQALLVLGAGVPATNTLSVPVARTQYEGRVRLMAPPANVSAVTELLPHIDAVLAPFRPRMHWGKFFTLPPRAQLPLYEKLERWKRVIRELDPAGRFQNDFLKKNLFSDY